mmetsp:Transcript_13768/g.18370  ORF Transcript_13768/g.18370 Transcript_13768/m.18370 type:complete len:458 (-) Transcript_13768:15-1388(-)
MGTVLSKGGLVFQPPPSCAGSVLIATSNCGSDANASRFWLKTRLGSKIEAVFVDQRAVMTILFSHANAEDITLIYPFLMELTRNCHVNALAYSYSGYARSRDRAPSEADVYADIDAAWDYLVLMRGIAPDQILLYGRSIGSGPTVYLAERLAHRQTPPAGIVLQSPLLSIFRIAFNFRYTIPGDLFPNIDRIRSVACPVLLIHGAKDEVVPIWHGQELWLATPLTWRYKPFWIPSAGHNNIEVILRHSGLLFQKLSEFFQHCTNPSIQAKREPYFIRKKALLAKKTNHASPIIASRRTERIDCCFRHKTKNHDTAPSVQDDQGRANSYLKQKAPLSDHYSISDDDFHDSETTDDDDNGEYESSSYYNIVSNNNESYETKNASSIVMQASKIECGSRGAFFSSSQSSIKKNTSSSIPQRQRHRLLLNFSNNNNNTSSTSTSAAISPNSPNCIGNLIAT